jgi:hypothetical protein
MVRRMMNATNVVLITALAEVATTAGEIVSEAAARRNGTTVVGQARHRAMACATLERVAEAITVVIMATTGVNPQAQDTAVVAMNAAIPAVV